MTQWIEDPEGGRERGPVGVARAFAAVLFRPRHFFERAVAPGDQAPGITFAILVVGLSEGLRLALIQVGETAGPIYAPLESFGAYGPAESALILLVVALFLTPLAIHLLAAVQTLLLIPFAPDRGGISETVQVFAYAAAPCLLAWYPNDVVTLALTLWSLGLYVLGTHIVHDLSAPRALVLGALPGAIAFGFGFRGLAAITALIGGL